MSATTDARLALAALAEQVRQEAIVREWSMFDLGERAGVPNLGVRFSEGLGAIGVSELKHIADALDMPAAELMKRAELRVPPAVPWADRIEVYGPPMMTEWGATARKVFPLAGSDGRRIEVEYEFEQGLTGWEPSGEYANGCVREPVVTTYASTAAGNGEDGDLNEREARELARALVEAADFLASITASS